MKTYKTIKGELQAFNSETEVNDFLKNEVTFKSQQLESEGFEIVKTGFMVGGSEFEYMKKNKQIPSNVFYKGAFLSIFKNGVSRQVNIDALYHL